MISINNLEFAFKKKKPLFTGLSWKLDMGRTYGLFGLNGSGKTTLLNHISGMLFPADGECLINGTPSRNRIPASLSELFILPEQFDLPSINARDYVALHAPFYPKFNPEQFRETMIQFEVNSDDPLTELSYGQRKKFLISFGLACNTGVLLMDEPTNGLDIPSKSQFRKIMAASSSDERCTVISTHQVRDLESMIDQITVLDNGRIIFNRSLEEITQRLHFKTVRDDEAVSGKLYGEEILGGEAVVSGHNADTKPTEIDLELLFNAIIRETEAINRQFETEARA